MSVDHAVENHTLSRHALERAIEQAFPVVFARLNHRFHDAQLAEEVSLDCLSQAFELWLDDPTYFLHHDLTSWTGTRATWRAIDRLRARSRFDPLPDENPFDDERPTTTALPRQNGDSDRLLADRSRTWEALNHLDELDRKILIGHYYDGRSDQDLGTELFGESGTLTARGLRVWRMRQKAQARLRELLPAFGLDLDEYAGQAL